LRDPTFSRFGTIPACEGQTQDDSIYRTSIASQYIRLIKPGCRNSIVGVVNNHGGVGLEQQCAILNFAIFVVDIVLGLFRYRDDNG